MNTLVRISLVFLGFLLPAAGHSMSVGELENIFSSESETPKEIQEKIKKWFKEGCGSNLSWILDIKETESQKRCENDNQRWTVTTRVLLSHLESDFIFGYNQETNRVDVVFKEVSTWRICSTPFVYEVEEKRELCSSEN